LAQSTVLGRRKTFTGPVGCPPLTRDRANFDSDLRKNTGVIPRVPVTSIFVPVMIPLGLL
jgi:hypothetical protein